MVPSSVWAVKAD